MNALVPEGWTRTPKPLSRSSQAIQGLSAGWRFSTVRLVRVSLTLAVRLPVVVLHDASRFGRWPEGPIQPSVNTSRPIPGRSGTRENRCPQEPPQLIDKSLIHGPITHAAKVALSLFIPLVRFAIRHSQAGNGTMPIVATPASRPDG